MPTPTPRRRPATPEPPSPAERSRLTRGRFDFPEAMRHVAAGRRVTREAWNDPTIYLLLTEDRLKIHKADGSIADLITSGGDISGTDWTVVL